MTPPAMASWAACSIFGGPSSSGKPCPRLTAPIRVASADISANTVVAYGRSRDTVVAVEPIRATMRAAAIPCPTNRLAGALLGCRYGT